MKKRSSRNGSHFAGKIKTEHTIVEDFFELLQHLVSYDEIGSIIPGRIMRRGGSVKTEIKLTIPTSSGWKALGKSRGVTQEFFIVTDHPQKISAIMESLSAPKMKRASS